MNNPQAEITSVIKSLVEPSDSVTILSNIEKYFTKDSRIIHPMLNSPKLSGREGIKSTYKMLKVLTFNNKMIFHTVGWGDVQEFKGREYLVGLLDLTEKIQLRFLPLPENLNPVIPLRLIVRIELVKLDDDKWYIQKQEDNLPSDFGSTGIKFFGLGHVSDAVKWVAGVGTLTVASTLTYFGLF